MKYVEIRKIKEKLTYLKNLNVYTYQEYIIN